MDPNFPSQTHGAEVRPAAAFIRGLGGRPVDPGHGRQQLRLTRHEEVLTLSGEWGATLRHCAVYQCATGGQL